MKSCPFCAETIKDEAIKCRYCGSDLSPGTAATGPNPEVLRLVGENRKIEAIKLVRETSGLGLAEAKAYVESVGRSIGEPERLANESARVPPEASKPKGRFGCLMVVILVVGIALALALPNLIENLANEGPGSPALAAIPADVSFSATGQDATHTVRVAISKRVPEEIIRSVAVAVKANDRGRSEVASVLFSIPEMEPGAVWARANFTPELRIAILRGSVEDLSLLRGLAVDPLATDTIGSWLDDRSVSRIVIVRRKRSIHLIETFTASGATTTKSIELVEVRDPSGRRFGPKNPENGEHWIIDKSGDLQIRDRDGLILTAKKFP